MEPSEIEDLLRRHRRRRCRPWWCRCGLLYPCPPRWLAHEEQVRRAARAACDRYPWTFGQRPPSS